MIKSMARVCLLGHKVTSIVVITKTIFDKDMETCSMLTVQNTKDYGAKIMRSIRSKSWFMIKNAKCLFLVPASMNKNSKMGTAIIEYTMKIIRCPCLSHCLRNLKDQLYSILLQKALGLELYLRIPQEVSIRNLELKI